MSIKVDARSRFATDHFLTLFGDSLYACAISFVGFILLLRFIAS
jgi:hypothetical protein